MQKFNTLTSITAPLDRANIDTDARQWIALGTIFSFSNTQPVMTFNHKGAAVRIQKSIYFLNLSFPRCAWECTPIK
jgi:hypothetical protein